MDENETLVEQIAEMIRGSVEDTSRAVQVAERLRAALGITTMLQGSLLDLLELDPELLPEVQAAAAQVTEVGSSLTRALAFVTARMAVALDKRIESIGGNDD